MATVPTPLDPTAGDKLSASAFDSGVRDVLLWLMGVFSRVHAHSATSQNVASGATFVTIAFDGETYDTDNMHDSVTNNTRITFTTAGLYAVDIQVALNVAPAGAITVSRLNVRLNSGGSSSGGTALKVLDYGTNHVLQLTFKRSFSAADYIEIFVAQTSGVTKTTDNTGLATRVFAERIAN